MAEAVVRLRVDASGATRALNGVQSQTNKLQSAFGGLKTALGGIGFTLLAKQAVQTSANFEKLNVRLGLLTKANGTFAKSQQIATEAQKAFGLSATEALEGITDITARLAPLGVGVEDIKSTFFGFNTAAKLAGASAIESSNAFRQLAQALGSGRLAGDEFRSISEQIPTLLAPIAEELNVPIGKLKELAAEGKLTSDVVLRALRKIETDGAASLKELVANDPTQTFKNFGNAAEELSITVGNMLKPAIMGATVEITKFITALNTFVTSDAGKAAILIAGIATGIKLVAVAIPVTVAALKSLVFSINAVGVQSLIASGGLTGLKAAALLAAGGIGKTTLALGALKIAMATTGIGLLAVGVGALATAFFKARREAKEFQDLINEGNQEDVQEAYDKQTEAVEKLEERLEKARGNAKRGAKRALEEAEAQQRMLEGRLKTLESEEKITEAKKKQNEEHKKSEELIKKQQTETDKLKEKMMAVGEEIEGSIKNNLREAITGAQSFGQAMTNVLNKIRDKIIDAQIEKILGGFGENFGKSASGGKGKGIGGFLGGILGGLFANGGRPPVGKASIVGERGPEIFVPSVSGTIIPNNQIGGGGGVTNMVTVNVDASGSSVQGSTTDAQQLGEVLGQVIQQQLIKEKRAGGLLA